MNSLSRLLPAALLLVSIAAQAECDYDDFPRMEGMLVSSLGNNVQWNHSVMHGRGFRVAATLEQVKTFYANKWQEAVDFTEFDGWDQILHINKHCMMMVQVKAQNDRFSYGRMLLTNPPANGAGERPLGEGMPVPPGAQVVSDMRSDDDIREGRMVLLLGEDDLEATRAWYEAELIRQGWVAEGRSNQGNAFVLSYAKGRELMTVGLLRAEGRTQILINRMDR
jgi:hypothetical protein